MTPAEVAAFLRNYNVWRRGNLDDQPMPDPRDIGEAIDAAIEMIDRLEAAENELVEIRHGAAVANDTIKALRAKVAEMERQEPVAWYSKQYGFVYMSRQPGQFEHGSILYLRNGAPAWRIEGSYKVALLEIASLPHGTVFYTLLGAKGEEE